MKRVLRVQRSEIQNDCAYHVIFLFESDAFDKPIIKKFQEYQYLLYWSAYGSSLKCHLFLKPIIKLASFILSCHQVNATPSTGWCLPSPLATQMEETDLPLLYSFVPRIALSRKMRYPPPSHYLCTAHSITNITWTNTMPMPNTKTATANQKHCASTPLLTGYLLLAYRGFVV